MALFHFTVTQTKRSKGQSAIASAAYRSGEKLYSEYYGEYSDYTRKRGVICSDILLPPHAPKEYADRQTLWNAVEKAERGKNAQLAYSFEISLQNEFSLEENIALAREFLFREFVSRGMTVDVSFHEKECEDGGTPNPHFHFLCPIRPMEQDGTWGIKQRREYVLDEEGNRIRDANGKYVFNAVPTTDWGSPETLEHWREAWAEMCNAKFAEKGLDVRIDHRSYERQSVDLLPTIHEGATVRAMEKKGIRTEKGEFNRWIKATNAVIRDIKKKITLLFDWIAEAKAELAKPQAPDLVSLLNAYYTQRRAGAYSQKGKVSNLKEMNETFNYLRANGIYSLEDLEHRVSEHSAATESLKKTLDEQTARMKAIKQLYDSSAAFQSLKPVYDGLQKIKFEKPRAKYKAEHQAMSQCKALYKDHSETIMGNIRYTCYGKLRKQTDCTGQTGYTMHILDEIIDKMVRQIFSRLRGIPKEQLITSRYAKETAERKNHLQALQAERDKAEKDLLALKTEILAVIKGESAFPKDTLAEMIAAQEKKHTELDTLCEEASAELERNAELMANVSQLYEELISYADLYDSASFEAKKMIVSQLIRRVEVYRGYQIHVDFNFDLAQYLENSDELAC